MLRNFRAACLWCLALLGLLLLPAASYAQSGIQMLPPLPPAGELACADNGLPKVLAWDGVHPLYCIHNFVVTPDGFAVTSPNAAIGSMSFGFGPGTSDFNYDGGNDAAFFFAHTGPQSGYTGFAWSEATVNGRVPHSLLTLANNGNATLYGNLNVPEINVRGGAQEGGQVILNAPTDEASGERPNSWSLDNFDGDLFRIFRGSGSTAVLGLAINSSGNVGVGIPAPAAKLDVNGDVKIGNSNVSCSTANEGATRYNSTAHSLEFCNGTAWRVPGSNFGGMYIGTPGSFTGDDGKVYNRCSTPNPLTGDCTCPNGFNANVMYFRFLDQMIEFFYCA